jgi:hypothetical protein
VKVAPATLYLLSLTVVFGCDLPYFVVTYRPEIAERKCPLDEEEPLLPFAKLTTSFAGSSEHVSVALKQ